jgi:hypothetical protein
MTTHLVQDVPLFPPRRRSLLFGSVDHVVELFAVLVEGGRERERKRRASTRKWGEIRCCRLARQEGSYGVKEGSRGTAQLVEIDEGDQGDPLSRLPIPRPLAPKTPPPSGILSRRNPGHPKNSVAIETASPLVGEGWDGEGLGGGLKVRTRSEGQGEGASGRVCECATVLLSLLAGAALKQSRRGRRKQLSSLLPSKEQSGSGTVELPSTAALGRQAQRSTS